MVILDRTEVRNTLVSQLFSFFEFGGVPANVVADMLNEYPRFQRFTEYGLLEKGVKYMCRPASNDEVLATIPVFNYFCRRNGLHILVELPANRLRARF
jgi:hypothetical protein